MKKQDENLKKLGARVRDLRKLRQWSQWDLAKKAGISDGAVKMIETGRRWPRPATIRALCQALECDTNELYGSAKLNAGTATQAAMAQTIMALQAELGELQKSHLGMMEENESLRSQISRLGEEILAMTEEIKKIARREFPGVPLEIVRALPGFKGRWKSIARLLGAKKALKKKDQSSVA